MMKRFPLYAMLMALAVLQAVGAEIRGIITDPNGSPVPQAMIILNYNDSATLILESDAKGAFRCAADPSDTIYIEVQAVGYEPLSVTAEGSAEALNLSLQPAGKTVDLDEVVVEADRSGVMERMANGKRFFLSKRAREMNDPFMALQEIPVLASDPFNSTVTTVSGDAPLVLVDGLEVNS
ncbi:MAG: carboxypeptidase-like regulatory domain-containing protein, partial [Muribaculaceae bacterium]|nr:carboxypeptidase-like regulatory domain-containing protein [Muribaculaceae bacterium]